MLHVNHSPPGWRWECCQKYHSHIKKKKSLWTEILKNYKKKKDCSTHHQNEYRGPGEHGSPDEADDETEGEHAGGVQVHPPATGVLVTRRQELPRT